MTPTPSRPPGSVVGIKIGGIKASSQLSTARAPKFAIDGDVTTTWKTKDTDSADQFIEITIPRTYVTSIQLWAGWQVTRDLYFGNRRPHNVSITFNGKISRGVPLLDTLGSQHVDLPADMGLVNVTRIRITILDFYEARKTSAGGSPTKETAISEIRVFGIPMP